MFSYHFNMHLFRAKTFLCHSNSQTQTFRYRAGPLSKTKGSVTGSVNKTTQHKEPSGLTFCNQRHQSNA